MTTASESSMWEELDFDDPAVRAELLVILKALARLLEQATDRAKMSRAFQQGMSIHQRKTKKKSRIH